jgi:DNA polymerase III epsilon subunit-like protein
MRLTFHGFDVLFIDIEASGLSSASFPIEIGWVLDDEARPESFLVRPHTTWNFDTGWSAQSAALHGITPAMLEAGGISVDEACTRLDEAIHRQLVVSDAPRHDDWWFDRLYAAASREKTWAVGDVERLYGGLAQEAGLASTEAAHLLTRIEQIYPHPHRAGPDALRLAKAARALTDPEFRSGLYEP